MGSDSLLFQQHDCRFDLRVLRFDRERNRDFINDFGGQDSRQLFDRPHPGRAVKLAASKGRIAIYITNHPVSQVLAKVELREKALTASAAAHNQQSLYVVTSPAQSAQVEAENRAHAANQGEAHQSKQRHGAHINRGPTSKVCSNQQHQRRKEDGPADFL